MEKRKWNEIGRGRQNEMEKERQNEIEKGERKNETKRTK